MLKTVRIDVHYQPPHTWNPLFLKDEINTQHFFLARQRDGDVKLLGSDSSNNRQLTGNILTVIKWACNQRGVRSNRFSTGKQLEGRVEVRSSPFQQQPSNYHRPFNDALTSQMLITTQRDISQHCVVLNICKLPTVYSVLKTKPINKCSQALTALF